MSGFNCTEFSKVEHKVDTNRTGDKRGVDLGHR